MEGMRPDSWVLYAIVGEMNSEKALALVEWDVDKNSRDRSILHVNPSNIPRQKLPIYVIGVPCLYDTRTHNVFTGSYALEQLIMLRHRTDSIKVQESGGGREQQRHPDVGGTSEPEVKLPVDPRDAAAAKFRAENEVSQSSSHTLQTSSARPTTAPQNTQTIQAPSQIPPPQIYPIAAKTDDPPGSAPDTIEINIPLSSIRTLPPPNNNVEASET